MNAKTFLTIGTLTTGAWLTAAYAQNTGTAGEGAAATTGSIRGSTASTTGATPDTGITVNAAPTPQSPGGANIGVPPAPGTIDTTPTMPSHSVMDRTTQPAPGAPGGNLPPGLNAVPPRPGISSMSGIKTSDLPAVSAGTAPIGAPPETNAARTAATSTQPIAGAAQPEANTQIGMGHTTVVPTPPPAAHVEVPSPTTTDAANQVWVPGHYSWLGSQWVWMEGGWQRPPAPNAVWVVGTYDSQNHRWTEGHWDTTATAAARDRNAGSTTPAPAR